MSNTSPDDLKPPDDLLTTGEAAKLLRVHRATLYGYVERGRLRAWRREDNGPMYVSRAECLGLYRPVAVRGRGEAGQRERPGPKGSKGYERAMAELARKKML